VVKYGGNAMISEDLKRSIISNLCEIHRNGWDVVIVHGGGPFINRLLDEVNLESEFISGHRKTTKKAIRYIEMALLGEVNPNLVAIANTFGVKAIGLSGKDARTIVAKKRLHLDDGKETDLGQVGDVAAVSISLIQDLHERDYLPIIGCIATDKHGLSHNINADMMAGAIAGALKASVYMVLTDVDGLQMDKDRPETLIQKISSEQIARMIGTTIHGGMIPKVESCQIALDLGAEKAVIMNGTKPDQLIEFVLAKKSYGTIIHR
jgi:acetylglutamate kinase